MENLLTGIMTQLSASTLFTYVGGRVYLDNYPEDETPPVFPHVIFSIVSSTPQKTFSEDYSNTTIQVSLYSASASMIEITAMHGYLETALDEVSLTITGSTLVWIKETNMMTLIEEATVLNGTTKIKHWAVDFEVLTSLN